MDSPFTASIKSMLPLRLERIQDQPNTILMMAGDHHEYLKAVRQMEGGPDDEFMPFVEYMMQAVNEHERNLREIQRLRQLLAECHSNLVAVAGDSELQYSRLQYVNRVAALRDAHRGG